MTTAVRVTLVAVCGLATGASFLQADDALQLKHVSPRTLRPGHTVRIAVHGPGMETSTGLWIAADAQISPPLEVTEGKALFEVSTPEDLPVGITALRVLAGGQVSRLVLMAIDDLPFQLSQSDNTTREMAQGLTLPVAVEGVIKATESQCFRFAGRRGQRIAVDVLAARLGSNLDPLVQLTGAHGKLLATSDDDPGQGSDSRLTYLLPDDGEYYLELRDARHHGGPAHFYHLRLGNFPLVRSLFPLAVRHGQQTTLEVIDDGPSVHTTPFVAPQQGSVGWVGVRPPTTDTTTFAPVLLSDLQEAIETEGDDTRTSPQQLSIPSAINGSFQQAFDRDWYAIPATAGQKISITSHHATLGVPTKLFMRLYDAEENKLAETAQAGSQPGALYYHNNHDQTLLLEVQELHHRQGPGYVYRIEILEGRRDFALTVDANRFEVPQSGLFVVNVNANRQGYQGPIELSVTGLDNAHLENNVIAKEKESTELRIRVPENIPSGTWKRIRIIGQPEHKTGETHAGVVAQSLTTVAEPFSPIDFPSPDWRESVAVGIGLPFPQFFQLTARPGQLRIAPGTDRLTLQIVAERSPGFEGPIELVVSDLPGQAKAHAKTIAADQTTQVIELRSLASLGEGTYRFQLTGSATFEHQPQQFALNDLSLRVGSPLEIDAQLAGPMSTEGKQQVRLHVRRFTEDRGSIEIALGNQPAGIRLEQPATIDGSQETTLLQLVADIENLSTESIDLVFTGTTTIAPPPRFTVKETPVGEQLPEEELREIGILREAESFDRGNVTIDHEKYGKDIGIISDPGAQQNFVEYDIQLPQAGMYQVELRYAATNSRPGQLVLNSEVLKKDAIAEATGGWLPENQQWIVEGVFEFRAGGNTLRLQSEPLMSHIDKVLIVPAGSQRVLEAKFDSWISEGSATTAAQLDGNLVSVFASENSITGKWRVGILQFDLSELATAQVKAAHLQLAVDGRDSPLAKGLVRAATRLLPHDVTAAELSGTAYPEIADRSVLFEKLGRFTIKDGQSGPAGSWDQSHPANSVDLATLNQQIEAGHTKLVIALEALEDGAATARDWGANDEGPQGTHGGPLPPQLVLRVTESDRGEPETVTVESTPLKIKLPAQGETPH